MAGETLKTVERTLQVLRAFDRETPELSVAAIARRLGVSRTAATRILVTLEKAGFLERAPDNLKYRIGLAACEVGALYLIGNPLVGVADEVLQRLSQATGNTAYLGGLYGDEVVILGLREGQLPVRFVWSAGERLPVSTTSIGKAMLMHMEPEQIDAILGSERLSGLAPGSIRTRAELDAQLSRFRSKGWIPAIEESYPGICAIGAAVRNAHGVPIAGISLSFLGSSEDSKKFERLGTLVHEAAQDISKRLVAYDAYAQGRVLPAGVSRGAVPAAPTNGAVRPALSRTP